MTAEQKAAILAMLKIDLGISAAVYDERFEQLIDVAADMIQHEGCNLDYDSARDQQLIVMYAGWQWRRRDSMEGMPRMLRYALNNRIFGEHMR